MKTSAPSLIIICLLLPHGRLMIFFGTRSRMNDSVSCPCLLLLLLSAGSTFLSACAADGPRRRRVCPDNAICCREGMTGVGLRFDRIAGCEPGHDLFTYSMLLGPIRCRISQYDRAHTGQWLNNRTVFFPIPQRSSRIHRTLRLSQAAAPISCTSACTTSHVVSKCSRIPSP